MEWTPEQYRAHLEKQAQATQKAKKSKFKNKWVEVDGIKFQSKREGDVYVELKRRMQIGEIKSIDRQKRYEFIINGLKVTSYRADFVIELSGGGFQVIDVKSPVTRNLNDYVIRKKLMKAMFDIEIVER